MAGNCGMGLIRIKRGMGNGLEIELVLVYLEIKLG